MPVPLLISLPVHERPDIAAGQVANIRQAAPNSLVCLHVSPEFTGDMADFLALESRPGIFINRQRLPTARGHGLLHVHIANFEFMRQRHETFATFLCLSSNELFIRGGLEAYAARNPIAYQFVMFEPAIAWHMFNRGLEHDPRVRALLSDVRLPVFFGGQAEGQYFPAALFHEIAALYRRHFGAGPAGFESEEIIPQTIALAAAGEMQPIAPPITFQNYCNFIDITPEIITKLRTGRGCLFSARRPITLASPHIGVQNLHTVFSVKRIPREACEIRDYIINLPDQKKASPVLV